MARMLSRTAAPLCLAFVLGIAAVVSGMSGTMARAQGADAAQDCQQSPQADIEASRFGIDLLAAASGNGGGTAVVSPLSVEAALAMASYGASDPLHRAMQRLFVEDPSAAWRPDCRLAAVLAAAGADAGIDTNVANGIFALHGLEFYPAFRAALEDRFGARVARLDFTDPRSIEAINGWVESETAGLIPQLLEKLEPDTVLVLVNALYFKGKWAHPFDPALTASRPFHPGSGAVVERPTMLMDNLPALYREDESFQAVELLYGDGGFALTVVLPRPGKLPADALATLRADPSWFGGAGFREADGRLLLPRLNLNYSADILPFLERLGLDEALRAPDAFSRISSSDRTILSEAIHGAVLALDEEGTEAAAATALVFVKSIRPRFDMQVDRPFALVVRSRDTGDILFAAWVDDPGQSEPEA